MDKNNIADYYINVNCCDKDNTASIDADGGGWHLLKEKISELILKYENAYATLRQDGGILTEFQSSNDYKIIKKIEFAIIEAQEKTNKIELLFKVQEDCLVFYASIEGYQQLLESFDSLLNYRGKYPADISYFSDVWGGDELTKSFVDCDTGDVIVHHLRLFRWK